ncbi:MAG: sialate O-acetylesterase, partial [Chitinispirillaceae bacterium]|nr:sialate O-acetylesterase [Chitinispirillaceae bacterium]
SIVGNNAWDWMLTKCKEAIKRGVFTGIILHQGESNNGEQDWPDKVKKIYDDLKKELGLTKDVPLVAGELLYSGCCSAHNKVIAQLPQKLPFAYVASAQGLQGGGTQPQYHFNTDGYREMGKRMAKEMIKGLREIAKTYAFQPKPRQRIFNSTSKSELKNLAIYSLDGKLIASKSKLINKKTLQAGNLYIVRDINFSPASSKLILIPLKN